MNGDRVEPLTPGQVNLVKQWAAADRRAREARALGITLDLEATDVARTEDAAGQRRHRSLRARAVQRGEQQGALADQLWRQLTGGVR